MLIFTQKFFKERSTGPWIPAWLFLSMISHIPNESKESYRGWNVIRRSKRDSIHDQSLEPTNTWSIPEGVWLLGRNADNARPGNAEDVERGPGSVARRWSSHVPFVKGSSVSPSKYVSAV